MGKVTDKPGRELLPADILDAFRLPGEVVRVKPLGEGHINRTLCVTYRLDNGNTVKYVFQRINTSVFRMPEALMDNIVRVTGHIRAKAQAEGRDPERSTLRFMQARTGKYFAVDAEGGYWRVYRFIDRCFVYQQVEKAEDFEKAGVALGKFQNMLADFPADELCETIPNFHNTVSRFRDFEAFVDNDRSGRASSCLPEIEFVRARENYCPVILNEIARGNVPIRVTHNDTKLNNVLMDEATGDVLCLIDLDTVMPGSALYDFGDSIRFGASSALEDERDLSKVHFMPELYDAYKKGYLSQACSVLTETEQKLLPMSCIIMTLECGMRFLGDHIDGDNYFGISRENQNLDRARTQFKLVKEMEEYFEVVF